MKPYIFLFILLHPIPLLADNTDKNQDSKASTSKQELYRYIEYAQDQVKRRGAFTCSGIGYIDNGTAMDGDAFYFDAKAKELISIYGMGFCISAKTKSYAQSYENLCPPNPWKENKCYDKYREYLNQSVYIKK